MGVEEVGIGAAALAVVGDATFFRSYGCQQFTIYLMGFLSVFQSCPEIDAPTCAPARGLITLELKGASGGFLQDGIRQVVTRVKADEMALMTVMEVAVIPVVIPSLDRKSVA